MNPVQTAAIIKKSIICLRSLNWKLNTERIRAIPANIWDTRNVRVSQNIISFDGKNGSIRRDYSQETFIQVLFILVSQ